MHLLQRALRADGERDSLLLSADDGLALAGMPAAASLAEVNAATLRRLGVPAAAAAADRVPVTWGTDAMQVVVGSRLFEARASGSGLEDGGALHPAARHWMQRALRPALAEAQRVRARVDGRIELVAGAATQVVARARQSVAIATHADAALRPWAHSCRTPPPARPLLVVRHVGPAPILPDAVARCIPPACLHLFPLVAPGTLVQDLEQWAALLARIAAAQGSGAAGDVDAAAEDAWARLRQWDEQLDAGTRALDIASAACMADDDSADVVTLLTRPWWQPFAHALTPLALAPWLAGSDVAEHSPLLDGSGLVALEPTTASASSYHGTPPPSGAGAAPPPSLPPGAPYAAAWAAAGVAASGTTTAAAASPVAPYWSVYARGPGGGRPPPPGAGIQPDARYPFAQSTRASSATALHPLHP
jgi:hypothetical protein